MFIKPLFKENQKNMTLTTITLNENELEAVFLGLLHRSEMAARNQAEPEFPDYWRAQLEHSRTAIQKCQDAYDGLEFVGGAPEKSAVGKNEGARAALQEVRQKIMNNLIWINGETADHLDRGKSIAKLVGQAQGLIDAIGYVEQVHFDYEELPF